MLQKVFIALLLVSLGSCGNSSAPTDPRIEKVRSGQLSADNLIVFDQGVRRTFGTRVLADDGEFRVAGPTVVYVFRSFSPGDVDQWAQDGINAEENTAYLLPEGASASIKALQLMHEIGPIDASMSDQQLAQKFGAERVSATAELFDAIRRGASDEELEAIRRRYRADHEQHYADQPLKTRPINFTRCTSYSGLDPAAVSTQEIDVAYLTFAKRIAANFEELGSCEAKQYEWSTFNSYLADSCAKSPDKTIHQVIVDFVCVAPPEKGEFPLQIKE